MKGKREHKTGKMILIMVIAMTVLIFLLSLGTAELILSGLLPEDSMEICALVIGGLTSFSVCLYCGIKVPGKKFLWTLTAAGGCCAVLFLSNLMFFGIGFGKIWPMILTVLGAGILAAVISAGKHGKYA